MITLHASPVGPQLSILVHGMDKPSATAYPTRSIPNLHIDSFSCGSSEPTSHLRYFVLQDASRNSITVQLKSNFSTRLSRERHCRSHRVTPQSALLSCKQLLALKTHPASSTNSIHDALFVDSRSMINGNHEDQHVAVVELGDDAVVTHSPVPETWEVGAEGFAFCPRVVQDS